MREVVGQLTTIPFTGLDSHASYEVVSLLKDIAQRLQVRRDRKR